MTRLMLLIFPIIIFSGCAVKNERVGFNTIYKNVKEDRYVIYDVTDEEQDFMIFLQNIMNELDEKKLVEAPKNNGYSEYDLIKKYF